MDDALFARVEALRHLGAVSIRFEGGAIAEVHFTGVLNPEGDVEQVSGGAGPAPRRRKHPSEAFREEWERRTKGVA